MAGRATERVVEAKAHTHARVMVFPIHRRGACWLWPSAYRNAVSRAGLDPLACAKTTAWALRYKSTVYCSSFQGRTGLSESWARKLGARGGEVGEGVGVAGAGFQGCVAVGDTKAHFAVQEGARPQTESAMEYLILEY